MSKVKGFKKNTTYIFKYRDAADCLRLIVNENWMKPDFIKEGVEEVDDDGNRLYTGPETGNWWIQSQVLFFLFYGFV